MYLIQSYTCPSNIFTETLVFLYFFFWVRIAHCLKQLRISLFFKICKYLQKLHSLESTKFLLVRRQGSPGDEGNCTISNSSFSTLSSSGTVIMSARITQGYFRTNSFNFLARPKFNRVHHLISPHFQPFLLSALRNSSRCSVPLYFKVFKICLFLISSFPPISISHQYIMFQPLALFSFSHGLATCLDRSYFFWLPHRIFEYKVLMFPLILSLHK